MTNRDLKLLADFESGLRIVQLAGLGVSCERLASNSDLQRRITGRDQGLDVRRTRHCAPVDRLYLYILV